MPGTGEVRLAKQGLGYHALRPWNERRCAASLGGDKRVAAKEKSVRDLVFTLVTIVFFLVAIGYLRGCERLK